MSLPVEVLQVLPTTDDVSTNPYTLSGLTSGNDYEVYLRADCSGDNSDTSDWISVSFSTLPGCGDTVSFCYAGGLVKHTELESLGDLVTVTVNSGSTESGYDDLVIFDSLDTSGNVLYNTAGDHTGVDSYLNNRINFCLDKCRWILGL